MRYLVIGLRTLNDHLSMVSQPSILPQRGVEGGEGALTVDEGTNIK